MPLLVEIVSPDRAAFRGEATRLRAPGAEGSFEVLRGHAPLVAALAPGVVTVTLPDGGRAQYTVSGGFAEVLNDHVIVLAETVEAVAEIDTERARAAEERARQRLADAQGDDRAAAQAELDRARNRLRASMSRL